jgi:hypothetical protein
MSTRPDNQEAEAPSRAYIKQVLLVLQTCGSGLLGSVAICWGCWGGGTEPVEACSFFQKNLVMDPGNEWKWAIKGMDLKFPIWCLHPIMLTSFPMLEVKNTIISVGWNPCAFWTKQCQTHVHMLRFWASSSTSSFQQAVEGLCLNHMASLWDSQGTGMQNPSGNQPNLPNMHLFDSYCVCRGTPHPQPERI